MQGMKNTQKAKFFLTEILVEFRFKAKEGKKDELS